MQQLLLLLALLLQVLQVVSTITIVFSGGRHSFLWRVQGRSRRARDDAPASWARCALQPRLRRIPERLRHAILGLRLLLPRRRVHAP